MVDYSKTAGPISTNGDAFDASEREASFKAVFVRIGYVFPEIVLFSDAPIFFLKKDPSNAIFVPYAQHGFNKHMASKLSEKNKRKAEKNTPFLGLFFKREQPGGE